MTTAHFTHRMKPGEGQVNQVRSGSCPCPGALNKLVVPCYGPRTLRERRRGRARARKQSDQSPVPWSRPLETWARTGWEGRGAVSVVPQGPRVLGL